VLEAGVPTISLTVEPDVIKLVYPDANAFRVLVVVKV
jgi:hypothetical protein